MLVDSHCHLNYLDDPDAALTRARAAGVGAFLCIGVDAEGIDDVVSLADAHDDVWATAGQHPEAAAGSRDWLAGRLAHPRVVAVGETGLDYFHESQPEAQPPRSWFSQATAGRSCKSSGWPEWSAFLKQPMSW